MIVVEMSILQKILNYMTRIRGILDEGERNASIVKAPRHCAFVIRF